MLSLSLWLALADPAQAGRMGPWLDEPPSAVVDTAELPSELPSCSDMALSRGLLLPRRPELYSLWNPERAWGTPELVEVIQDAAEIVAAELPYVDPIAIGDLSRRGGGPLYGHMTHNSGLDADIGLFAAGGRQPSNGTFQDLTGRTIDHEATWALIRALLDTGRVEFILLDGSLITSLRSWLVAEAVLPPEEVDRLFPLGTLGSWRNDGVVRHAPGHRNHMHVRVRCI